MNRLADILHAIIKGDFSGDEEMISEVCIIMVNILTLPIGLYLINNFERVIQLLVSIYVLSDRSESDSSHLMLMREKESRKLLDRLDESCWYWYYKCLSIGHIILEALRLNYYYLCGFFYSTFHHQTYYS